MDDLKAKRLKKEALERAELGVGKAVKRVITATKRMGGTSTPRGAAKKSAGRKPASGKKRMPSAKQLEKQALALNKKITKAYDREKKKTEAQEARAQAR